jgi:DNA-binding XRE family transcriptional regulator
MLAGVSLPRLGLGTKVPTAFSLFAQCIHTPALPFCHLELKAKKPKESGYPREIKTLVDKLKTKRLDLGLKQRELAMLLSVSVDTINYWENNRVRPSWVMAEKFVGFLSG